MLSHQSVELQFECHLCKKSLRSAQSLQKHIKCHVGSKIELLRINGIMIKMEHF